MGLELASERFYHLDTCFCPLAPGEAIYFPEAFDAYGRRVLEANIPRLLPVAEAEAQRFGCNAVVVGKTVVLKPGGLHIMFLNLPGPLKQGEKFTAQLSFEKAGKVEVTFDVQPIGAREAPTH